ncbi:transglutaminase-like domain-containing protein [bacterium]|nr:transglutaminase-like domain-containing protein [bacterium]
MIKFTVFTCLLTLYSCINNPPTPVRRDKVQYSNKGNPCISILKEKMIKQSIGLKDEKSGLDDQLTSYYQNFDPAKYVDRNFEISKSEGDQRDYDEVAVEFKYKGGETLEYSLSQDKEQLEFQFLFSTEKDSIRFSIEKNFLVNESCNLDFRDFEILKGEDLSASEERLTKIYYNFIGEELKDSKIVPKSKMELDIDPKELFIELKSNGSIQKTGFIHIDFDITGIFSRSTILLGDETTQLNPFSKTNEKFLNASMEIENNIFGNIEILLSADLKNNYYTISVAEFSSYVEYFQSSQHFLNAKLDSTLENKVQMKGLSNEDFHSPKTLLKVITDYKDNMELLRNYFNISQISNKGYVLKMKTPKVVTLEYPSQTLIADEVYLTKSRFIELDHPKIIKLKNEVLSKSLETRAKILGEVLKLVNRELSYDHEQASNDLTRLLTLDEIFSKKEGVCQHYALVATSLLRSLGIPSRIAMGYSLDQKGATGHAWIEVKLNNKSWTPVEPQSSDDYFIWSLNYFPMGEMPRYEKGNTLFNKNFIESGLIGALKSYTFEKKTN